MPGPYDVVVVGARCAGSPLALQLARAGLSVVVVDRARFPSDTPSTHIVQVEGVCSLHRLGLLDRVLDSGAPWLANVDVRMGDIPRAVARTPKRPSPRWPAPVHRLAPSQVFTPARVLATTGRIAVRASGQRWAAAVGTWDVVSRDRQRRRRNRRPVFEAATVAGDHGRLPAPSLLSTRPADAGR